MLRSIDVSRKLPSLVASASFLLASPGCQRTVFSPPARTVALDAPRVLEPGKTAIGLFASSTTGIVDTEVSGGTLAVRRGLAEGIEGSVEGSAYRAEVPRAEDSNTLPGPLRTVPSLTLLSGRFGTKVALFRKHISLLGGLGGGHYAGGGFVTPDLGLTIGYDNRYVVPFVLGRGGLSQPIGSKEVDLTRTDEAPGSIKSRPRTTVYYGVTTGLRIPIEPSGSAVTGGIIVGVTAQGIQDAESSHSGLGVSGGGEIIF